MRLVPVSGLQKCQCVDLSGKNIWLVNSEHFLDQSPSNVVLKWAQSATKLAQRGSKVIPESIQSWPGVGTSWHKVDPKTAQSCPKVDAKSAHNWLETLQRESEFALRWPQVLPQSTPSRCEFGPESAQVDPRRHQGRPKGGPRSI